MFCFTVFLIDCDKRYNVESGEITNPLISRMSNQPMSCMYSIRVPLGRRITVEVVKGNSIVQTCDLTKNNPYERNGFINEKLMVSFYVPYRS